MKPNNFHFIVMVMCFIFGGISFFIFLYQAVPLAGGRGEFTFFVQPNSSSFPFPNSSINFSERVEMRDRMLRFETRARGFYQIILVTSLLSSIVSVLAGLSIFNLLRKKEHKELTKSIVGTMTTSDEKKVMESLERKGGEATQSELVTSTGLSKVKVHRIVKRLEQLKIIKKYPYGMTNKIKLEQVLDK